MNSLDIGGSDGCTIDATILAPCLNVVVSARYNPLPAPAGIGPTDYAVEGFLWFTPATEPYNSRPLRRREAHDHSLLEMLP